MMNKQEFSAELYSKLGKLPEEEKQKSVDYFSEMIDERIEDGMTEEEAVAAVGTTDEAVNMILQDIPISSLLKSGLKSSHTLRVWEIILIVLGSPVWLSIGIVLLAVIISVFCMIWSLVLAVYAIFVSFFCGGLACVAAGILFMVTKRVPTGLFAVGAGLILIGLSVFLHIAANAFTKLMFKLSRWTVLGIKSLFIGRRRSK